jgi:hypothetical protein
MYTTVCILRDGRYISVRVHVILFFPYRICATRFYTTRSDHFPSPPALNEVSLCTVTSVLWNVNVLPSSVITLRTPEVQERCQMWRGPPGQLNTSHRCFTSLNYSVFYHSSSSCCTTSTLDWNPLTESTNPPTESTLQCASCRIFLAARLLAVERTTLLRSERWRQCSVLRLKRICVCVCVCARLT